MCDRGRECPNETTSTNSLSQTTRARAKRPSPTTHQGPMPKKKPTPKPTKSFEETLWDTANKLRGSVESSEYKHVVLSLIFLKFVSDKFEERRAELKAEGKEDYLDMVEFYTRVGSSILSLATTFIRLRRMKQPASILGGAQCAIGVGNLNQPNSTTPIYSPSLLLGKLKCCILTNLVRLNEPAH